MVEPYSVRVELQDDTTTIVLGGEIDLAAAPDLWAVVADVVLTPPSLLRFDFTDTTFMDSTAINALVFAHHAATMVGASIELTPSPAVARVLEISGVSSLFGPTPEVAAG